MTPTRYRRHETRDFSENFQPIFIIITFLVFSDDGMSSDEAPETIFQCILK